MEPPRDNPGTGALGLRGVEMTTSALQYLRDLVQLSGPSGAEEDVVRAIARHVRPLVDTVELDPFGNLIAVRQAARPGARRCILAAHMDEIGFRVRSVDAPGFCASRKSVARTTASCWVSACGCAPLAAVPWV